MLWGFETGIMCPRPRHRFRWHGSQLGSFDKKLYAVNPDGTKKWEFETGDAVLSSPSIGSDGTVYVGSFDNKLYAINPKNGYKLWEFKTESFIYSLPPSVPMAPFTSAQAATSSMPSIPMALRNGNLKRVFCSLSLHWL